MRVVFAYLQSLPRIVSTCAERSRRHPAFPGRGMAGTLFLVATLSLSLALPAGAALRGGSSALDNPALRAGGQEYLPGLVIVKLTQPLETAAKTTGRAGIDRLCAAHAVESFTPLVAGAGRRAKPGAAALRRIYQLRYTSGEDALQVARAFAADPAVEYAEPQFVYQLAAASNDPFYGAEQSAYFDKMAFPAAFDDTRGGDGDVVIAVVDGGSDWTHPDLQANLWSNPAETLNGSDDDGNGFVDDVRGWNFANGTNDPKGQPQTPNAAGHGTHVAGIACAVTNNSIGVAGAAWNAHFMPVCVGHPSVDGAIAFGYQGILYAVDAGADVINCSWGGQGNPSYFEREVIEYAHANDVVVVAAAGNSSSSAEFFPAAYPHVLAVANVNNSDQKISSSNYGPWVDVAAQGTNIHSTYSGGTYLDLNGTSMAGPHAAAACALVKTKFPTYSAEQVRERVRVTCDNIDAVNPGYVGQLGYGRIDPAQAPAKATPAIRIRNVVVVTPDGDAIIEPGETNAVQVTVINYLDPATNAQFTLSENSSYATVPVNADALAAIGTGEEALLEFSVRFTAAAPVNHLATLTLGISTTSPAYTDKDRFELRVLPITATLDANNVLTTVTSVGKLGFGEQAGGNGKDGVGFVFAGSPNLLFEGALMIGTGDSTISDAARGRNPSVGDDDFVTATNGTPSLSEAHPIFDQFAVAAFADGGATVPLGLAVRQESWVLAYPPYDDFIVIRYAIRNESVNPLNGMRVGWFFDWDLDGSTYNTNRTGYDASRGLGYVWDEGAGPTAYVGMRTLTAPGTTSYRGIWNDETLPANPSWGVYDGFSDAEKWEGLSGGIVIPQAGPADISQSLSTGPFTIAPGDSIVVAFALLGGSDLVDLQQNADAAQGVWDHPVDSNPVTAPKRLWLAQNTPNPFNPRTSIDFEVPRAGEVVLGVYAVTGRLVRTLLHERRQPGPYRVDWDGRDDAGRRAATGTYFYRLTLAGHSMTRKMQLLK